MHHRRSGSRAVKTWAAHLAVIMCLGAAASAQAPTERGRLGIDLTQITVPWTATSTA